MTYEQLFNLWNDNRCLQNTWTKKQYRDHEKSVVKHLVNCVVGAKAMVEFRVALKAVYERIGTSYTTSWGDTGYRFDMDEYSPEFTLLLKQELGMEA